MANGSQADFRRNGNDTDPGRAAAAKVAGSEVLHPAWRQFMRFCAELGHGDIERLRIQDGLPVLVELAIRKVKLL
jgi:hypothetical protein